MSSRRANVGLEIRNNLVALAATMNRGIATEKDRAALVAELTEKNLMHLVVPKSWRKAVEPFTRGQNKFFVVVVCFPPISCLAKYCVSGQVLDYGQPRR